MRRKFILLVSLILISGMAMTACGGNSTNESNNGLQASTGSTQAGATETQKQDVKELSFSWLINQWGLNNQEFNEKTLETPVYKKWAEMTEKNLGVKLNIKWDIVDQFDEATYLASGQYADVFTYWTAKSVNELGEDGKLVSIFDYDAPNYKKVIDYGDNKLKMQAADGNVYQFSFGFDTKKEQAGATQWVWIWKLDAFKKHNLKLPETLDELYTVTKQLKELYPKSYPMGSYVNADWYSILRVLLNINRTSQSYYYNGEKFVFGPIDDEARFKATLEYLNKFYKEGLLDPEFFTQTGDQAKEKIVNGTYFYVPNMFASNVVTFNSNTTYPGQEWGWGKRPKGFDGKEGWKPESNKEGPQLWSYGHVISKTAKNPELLVKMLDYQYTTEMIDFATFGIEGQAYTKTSDGKIQFLPELLDDPQKRAYYLIKGFGLTDGWKQAELTEKPQPCYSNGSYSQDNWLHFTASNYTAESIFPNELVPEVLSRSFEKDLRDKVFTPIDTYISECVIKFILGDMKFDQWNDFIAKIKSMGDYQKVLDLMNKNYQEMKAK